MRAWWGLVMAVGLGGLIAVGNARQAQAVSRQSFPEMRVSERLQDADFRTSEEIDALYLYGSLSLFEHPTGPSRIDLSGVAHPHPMPLVVFDIYHDIPTYIQSEFSDYTVWGVLDDTLFHDAMVAISETEAAHAVARRKTSRSKAVQGPQRTFGFGAHPLGRRDQRQFDLRSDYTFGMGDMARLHGEQRQFYAKSDFYAGRGGVDYQARGVIAQTLQRILQFANALMDNKALTIVLLAFGILVVKVTQGIMSRPF